MKVAIHQPCYLPYLGVFYKMWQADTFVFLDDAQFSTGYVFNWNRIKTPQGECRIKIPVDYNFGDPLTTIRTKDELGWKEKHLKTIKMNYSRAKFFKETFVDIREIILSDHRSLSELSIDLMVHIAKQFGLFSEGNHIIRASEMNIGTLKEQRVIDIVKAVGGDEYISGHGASAYQTEDHFAEVGIKLIYTDFQPPRYEQQWGDFIANLSVVDFVFNHGYDWDKVLKGVKEAKWKTN